MTAREEVKTFLESLGLSDKPSGYLDALHGSRCEHRRGYDHCTCFEEAVTAVMKLIGEEK